MATVRYLDRNDSWALVTEGRAIVSVDVGANRHQSLFADRQELVGALRRNGLQVDDKGAVSALEKSRAADKAAAYRDLPREQAQAYYPDLAKAYQMEGAARSMAAKQYGAEAAEAVAHKTREKIAAHIERGGTLRDLETRERSAQQRQVPDRAGPER